MTLPTLSEIYRIGFSSTHYGKQPYTTDTASPHTLLEDNDEGNVHEIYDYSKHSERSIPQGLDGSLERLMTMPDDIMYEVCAFPTQCAFGATAVVESRVHYLLTGAHIHVPDI